MTKISDIISVPTGTSATSTSNVIMPSYSTEEVLTTERWVDGKPIYRKVLNFENVDGETDVIISTTLKNTDVELISSSDFTRTNTNSAPFYLNIKSDGVYLHVVSGISSTGNLTVYYIKKTDTASSPVAQVAISTTSNMIMPSYSTDEVLTTERWVDGKPIYRKVISGTTPTDDITVDTGVVDGENARVVDFMIYSQNGTTYSGTMSYYRSDTSESRWKIQSDGSLVYISLADGIDNWINQPYAAIIEYTKTTDTASSPVAQVSVDTLGVNQTWQDVAAERESNKDYPNTTGKPITVSVNSPYSTTAAVVIIVDGILVVSTNTSSTVSGRLSGSAIVPAGSIYRVASVFERWVELR